VRIETADFNLLVERALQNSELTSIRPVIEKELMHYDILYCLDNAGLLNDLTFQGGTCLRLCYGANRFSEDLDFAGGKNYSSAHLKEMKSCIEKYIGGRYGLSVTVKEPASLKKDAKYSEIKIDKWQISVITSPERRNVPKQRIKIDVANIPAYTQRTLGLKKNYDFLPDGYEDTLIYTESLDEIMADKMISLPATQKYIRHRDLWDLVWLQQQGAILDISLVARKIDDYRLGNFKELLETRLSSLPAIIASKPFLSEMRRFLAADVFDRTLSKEKFKGFLEQSLTELFTGLHHGLYSQNQGTTLQFKL